MRLAAALFVVSSGTHADVVGELAAGAGGDTTAPTGFGMARASLAGKLSAPAGLPIERAFTDENHQNGFWMFTGIDPDDKNGVGANANATAHARGSSQQLVLDARAWARGYGWQLEARGAIEPITRFRD